MLLSGQRTERDAQLCCRELSNRHPAHAGCALARMQCLEALQEPQAALQAAGVFAAAQQGCVATLWYARLSLSSGTCRQGRLPAQLDLDAAAVAFVSLRVLFCSGRLDEARQLADSLAATGQLPCSQYAASLGTYSAPDTPQCRHHSTCQRLLSSHARNEAVYAGFIALLLGQLPAQGPALPAAHVVYLLGDSHCLSGERSASLLVCRL